MRTKLFYGVAVVVLSINLWGCPGSKSTSDAVELKFNLEKGKTYVYAMKTHFDMNMEMMGKKMETGGDVDFGFKMKVEDVDAQGNRMLSNTYDAIRFRMNAMGVDMGYDSKNTGDTTKESMMSGMFRKIFSGMVGKTFKMTMSPSGEVSKIEGLTEMVQSMSEHLDLPENMREKMSGQFKESFNEEQIKQSFQQGFGFYPGKPVKPGDSWTKNMKTNMNKMAMDVDTKYTVKEIKDNTAFLELSAVLKAAGRDSASVTSSMDIKGDSKGTMEIDLATGLNKHGRMDMTMKISSPALQQPMDMKMTVNMEGKQL